MIDADELEQARQDLDAELPDTVTVRRKTGTTFNEQTLEEQPTYSTLAEDLAALVVLESQNARVHLDVGDKPVVTQLYMVTVPATLTDVQPADEILVTATQDGRLDGRVLYVQDPRVGSISISRRIVASDVPTGG